ncbi:MAG: hypothetical protein E7571_02125 [Ruminococcaceae bacterium]|nr:hypothetical protein [Oscillospiraceae bacterium]
MIYRKKRTYFDKDSILHGMWTAAAVLCAVFSPLGILIAALLFIYQYRHYEGLDNKILFCGIADIVFCSSLGMMIAIFSLSSGDMKVALIMAMYYAQGIPCGIMIIAFHFIIRRRKNLCESCLMLINKEHIVSIEKISSVLGVDYKKTEKIVGSLIKTKRLENATIDKKAKELVFEKSIWAKQHVVCENCGAELVVDFGQTLVCEFCGSCLKVRRIDNTPNKPN